MNDRCPTCGGRFISWTPAAIIEAAQAWHKAHGEPPTANKWRGGTHDHPAYSTALRAFGSWNKMIEAAGFTPQGRGRRRRPMLWTREQTVHAIFTHRFEHGRLPRYSEWFDAADGRPSSRTVVKLFGSWNGAIVAAGYTPTVAYRSKKGYRAVAASVTKAIA